MAAWRCKHEPVALRRKATDLERHAVYGIGVATHCVAAAKNVEIPHLQRIVHGSRDKKVARVVEVASPHCVRVLAQRPHTFETAIRG